MKIKNFEEHSQKPCIIIVGPPGSGKGTYSSYIHDKTGFIHLSTGDIIRNSGEKELMDAAAAGNFISDEDVLRLTEEFIKSKKSAPGFIFDGYPRTSSQVKTFPSFLKKNSLEVAAIIVLKADQDELLERLLKRAKLEKREDDQEDKIRKRFDDFQKKTEPGIEKLVSLVGEGKTHEVTSKGGIEKVNKKIQKILDEINLI